MPTSTIKRTGTSDDRKVFVATAGKSCTIVLNVKNPTTTFLYCKKSAIGINVNGLKRVDLTLLVGACCYCLLGMNLSSLV